MHKNIFINFEIGSDQIESIKQSLSFGIFPDVWKTTYVIDLHKGGPKHLTQNNRPISKLFEWLIDKSIYFLAKSQINPEQHGFLKKKP